MRRSRWYKTPCSSVIITYYLETIPVAFIILLFPVWSLNTQFLMFILIFKIISVPIFNWGHFAKVLVFACFWFWVAHFVTKGCFKSSGTLLLGPIVHSSPGKLGVFWIVFMKFMDKLCMEWFFHITKLNFTCLPKNILSIYFNCMFLSCHVRVSESINTI